MQLFGKWLGLQGRRGLLGSFSQVEEVEWGETVEAMELRVVSGHAVCDSCPDGFLLPLQKDIVEAGGIAATVQLLEDGKPAEQQMAACVVARLAEDDSLRERLLQAPEVVPGLLGMMEDSSQGNSPARATAAKALELLVDSQSGPEAAHQAEAVPALLKVAGQCDQGDSDGELGTRSLRVLISLARNKDLRREIVKVSLKRLRGRFLPPTARLRG